MSNATKKVAADVPQVILDKVNEVNWFGVKAVAGLVKELKMGIKLLRLKKKEKGAAVAGSGHQKIMADVPQEILDELNLIQWNVMPGDEIRRLGNQLAGQIAKRKLPYKL